ncbi:MAG TPA: class I SAM-dependent RNA methyltransferase [Stellaceae bacterium]|nr:class I SAM-dependent RNA methyltransferase [Stellaceae bacterium]
MATELLIDELNAKGEGVGRPIRTAKARENAYIYRALPGDRVEAALRRDIDRVLRGDVVAIVEASPHRVEAPCAYYGACGGCTMQHARDDFYRSWKLGLVRTALARAGLEPQRWQEPVFLPPGGRRRATFTALKRDGRVSLGYSRRGLREVVDIAACLVVDPAVMALQQKLPPLLAPLLREGEPATAFIQSLCGGSEIVLTGPIGTAGKPDLSTRDAIARLAAATGCSRIAWRARLGDLPEVLLETRPLIARFGALDIAVPPLAFLQPTEAGARALTQAVMAALPPRGAFADLFCGCGTFAGPMLERGAVDAFDHAGPAIDALGRSHAIGLRAIRRDLFREPLRRDEVERYDAIVFDPPRAGAHEQSAAVAGSKVPVVVAVSCNPATFARDARLLVDGGYRLDAVTVVDQFTWSHHVELVAAFSKCGGGN